MAEPSDDGHLDEIFQARARRRWGRSVAPDGDVSKIRIPVMHATVIRLIESRAEEEMKLPGIGKHFDLDTYTDLDSHPASPPDDPYAQQSVKLLKAGSVLVRRCDCGDGYLRCKQCTGKGKIPCSSTTTCSICNGRQKCRACYGKGRVSQQVGVSSDSDHPRYRSVPQACSTCVGTGKCASCGGKGKEDCSKCEGRGWNWCAQCDGEPLTSHDRCGGTGQLTTFTVGTIAWSPTEKSVRAPSRDRLPVQVGLRIGRVPADWDETIVEDTTTVPDALHPDLRKALECALGDHPGQVRGRTQVRSLELIEGTVSSRPGYRYYAYRKKGGEFAVITAYPRAVILLLITAVAISGILAILVLI